MLLTLLLCLTSPTADGGQVQGGGEVLRALQGALTHYVRSTEPLSDGAIFGVLLLQGQLYASQMVNPGLTYDINELVRMCETIIEKNPRSWIDLQLGRDRARRLAVLMLNQRERSLGGAELLDYKLEENLLPPSGASVEEWTACILEALYPTGGMSTGCYLQGVDPRARGYALSHQAIYFLLSRAMSGSGKAADAGLWRACRRMLSEVSYAWDKGPSSQLTDLFVEEIAVCGLSGVSEAVDSRMLKLLLNLQTAEGCFSAGHLAAREKCEDHLTAVGMVALGNFLFLWSKDGVPQRNIQLITSSRLKDTR